MLCRKERDETTVWTRARAFSSRQFAAREIPLTELVPHALSRLIGREKGNYRADQISLAITRALPLTRPDAECRGGRGMQSITD